MKLIAVMNEEDGFSAVLDLAELLGWEDTHGDITEGGAKNWTAAAADDCEADALAHIENQNVAIVWPQELGQ